MMVTSDDSLASDGDLVCYSSHQTHYEQWGELWGTFVAEGHPTRELRLRGYHDHSYGNHWHFSTCSVFVDLINTFIPVELKNFPV